MTWTRGSRLTAVIALMTVAALTVWFWENQRHAQAEEDTLAGQILCYINSVSGPPILRFHVGECPISPPPPTPSPACSNGIDDDGDGLIDWDPTNGDPGCTTLLDTDATNAPLPPPPPPPASEDTLLLCSDGEDNDGDSLIYPVDPNFSTFNPNF